MCIAVPIRGVVLAVALVGCGGGGGGGGGSAASGTPGAKAVPPLVLSTFQAAAVVIGQANFSATGANRNSGVGANTLSGVTGAPAEGSLYVADRENHRILGFATIPTANDASAVFVIGQPDFVSDGSGTSASQFDQPINTVTGSGADGVSSPFILIVDTDVLDLFIQDLDPPDPTVAFLRQQINGVRTETLVDAQSCDMDTRRYLRLEMTEPEVLEFVYLTGLVDERFVFLYLAVKSGWTAEKTQDIVGAFLDQVTPWKAKLAQHVVNQAT